MTERDRARMRLIARAMDELNKDAVKDAALRDPGQNIEVGLRLGNAALLIAQHQAPRPEPVAPVTRWRATRAGR